MNDEGITCECGSFVVYNGYVYAHWYENILFTCNNCGKQYNIKKGKVTPVQVEENDLERVVSQRVITDDDIDASLKEFLQNARKACDREDVQ